MVTRSYNLPPRRRGLPGRRVLLALLALVWLVVGLVAATRYFNAYYEHRGFAQLKRPPGVAAGKVMTVRFYSPALHRQADYLVYVPTHYNPARRYPVLYLLHGTPGRPQNFINIVDIDVRLDTLISRARVVPMVLVFPDGRVNGSMFSDSEWANAGHGNYESYVLDVMHDVDHRFPTQPARTARVLAGYSEGGFGATNIGLHHLDSFAGIESWSGYFVENRFGAFKKAGGAQIAANSPLDYAAGLGAHLARHPLRAFFYGGTQDPETKQLPPMVNELRSVGARASYARFPGAHDWALWHAHVDQMLVIASNDFRARAQSAHPLSRAAARRAARAGRAAARAAQILERRLILEQNALTRVCRADATNALSTATAQTRGMSAGNLSRVENHVIYDCELAFTVRQVRLAFVPGVLCGRLPSLIGIVNHAARRRAVAITARCLRLADQPAVPTPSLLSSPPRAGAPLGPAGRVQRARRVRLSGLRRPRRDRRFAGGRRTVPPRA